MATPINSKFHGLGHPGFFCQSLRSGAAVVKGHGSDVEPTEHRECIGKKTEEITFKIIIFNTGHPN